MDFEIPATIEYSIVFAGAHERSRMEEPLYKMVNGVIFEMTGEEVAEVRKLQTQAQIEQQRQQEEFEQQRQSAEAELDAIAYSHRLVAFIDVLGWSQLIDRALTEPKLLRVLGSASQIMRGHSRFIQDTKALFQQEADEATEVSQFSDSIVISCPATPHGLSEIERSLWFLSRVFLSRQILIRGAIVAGPIYHRDSIVFGPALIAAYEAEKAARYPRITLDKCLAASVGRGREIHNPQTGEIYHDKTWRTDPADGVTFYDFLQPPAAKTSSSHRRRAAETPLRENYAAELNEARKVIVTGLQIHNQTGPVREKYLWMAEYFNAVASEYPASAIMPITVGVASAW